MDRCAKELLELSPIELAAELSMGSGHYLLVEGESDKSFWKHLQTEGLKKRHIIIANKRECSGNKDYVKKVISMINERKRKNAVGVVDMDYDCINGHIEAIENLYYYKYIDLENVLIQSPNFTEVNGMISSPGKKQTDAELREMLYSRTFILGLLRLGLV